MGVSSRAKEQRSSRATEMGLAVAVCACPVTQETLAAKRLLPRGVEPLSSPWEGLIITVRPRQFVLRDTRTLELIVEIPRRDELKPVTRPYPRSSQ